MTIRTAAVAFLFAAAPAFAEGPPAKTEKKVETKTEKKTETKTEKMETKGDKMEKKAADTKSADGAKPGEGAPAAMAMPKPAPEMAQLKFFVGNWRCNGKAEASPFGPAHGSKTTTRGKIDLDGFWLTVSVDEQKSKESPMPIHGRFASTYDGAGKKFVGLWYDNFGAWELMTSPGFEGDTITFSGDAMMGGQKIPAKDAFTRKGDKEMVHTGEMEMQGKWMKLYEETCKR